MRSAVRYELFLLMEQLAPCSVSQIAAASGRGAAGLYRHLEVMAKAGILLPAGQQKSGGGHMAGQAVQFFLDIGLDRHDSGFLKDSVLRRRFTYEV